MLNPPIRETETCLDTDRQFSDFRGTTTVITIRPWLSYPFSLLLTAASQASDTFSAAAALFPTHTLLPHRASTTLCMAGQQTDSAENLPGSKIQFLNVIYHKAAWTAVWAQREKPVRGWEHAALGMGSPSWSHCHQGHALSSQILLQCRGQTAFLFEKMRWCSWQSFLAFNAPAQRMMHVAKVR